MDSVGEGGNRVIWLIMYDITNKKRLSRTIRLCRDFGLRRIQKSVYLGILPLDIAVQFRERLLEYVSLESDQAIMLQLTKKQLSDCVDLCAGQSLSEVLEPQDAVFV